MKPAARIALAVAALLAAPAACQALTFNQIAAYERSVKTLPMSERPNRLGHVYGNNVRRVQQGRFFVNAGRYPRPMLRYFYIPNVR